MSWPISVPRLKRFMEVRRMSERNKAIHFNRETRDALRTVYDELNHGQRQKLLKNEKVKELFERYKVLEVDE